MASSEATTTKSASKEAVSSHLDNGRPLYLRENVKGASGSNSWMWEKARLIMPTSHETKSSKCMGAWCLRCEELGKSVKECHINYNPQKNFKAISRHFRKHHEDLEPAGAGKKKAAEKRPSTTGTTRDPKRIKIALTAEDAIPKCQVLLCGAATRKHRIVSPPTIHPCGEGRQVMVTEHMMPVPLYRSSNTGSIDIYFTIVEKTKASDRPFFENMVDMAPEQRAAEYVTNAGLVTADDMMLFLQGGPGFGAPTPFVRIGFEKHSSWAARALDQYSRIVLMDQRGTGRSSPITKQSLQKLFPDLFLLDLMVDPSSTTLGELETTYPEMTRLVEESVVAAAEFLAQFRADSIVQDAEAVKDALLQKKSPHPRPWGCSLGQSFGGFCMLTYLSKIQSPPRICLLTGGIAPMLTPIVEAYSSLWQRVKQRNLCYYQMYPGDIPIVKLIVKTLLEEPAPLPSGGLLTARRFLQTGIALGGGPNAFATLHELLAGAFLDGGDDEVEFKVSFLKRIDSFQSYDDNPFYYWLHEAIYVDGPNNSPTAWAAHRAYEKMVDNNNEFNYQNTCSLEDNSAPTLFFGEMVFPWMSADYEDLGGVGMKALSHALASKTDWGPLYDGNHMKKVLSDGSCRASAAVYYEDMYVDFDASMKVAARGAPLENCKVWVTNEYQHSGIKDDGARVFAKLHGMATGGIR